MESRPSPLPTALLLGACFMGLGLLLWLWTDKPEPLPAEIHVDQRVIAPDGTLIYNGTVLLAPGNGTVEGALLRAADLGDFSVNITKEYFGKSFVKDIAGYRNEKACGWVFDVDGVRSPHSVDQHALDEGDAIRWYWDCVG